MVILVDTNIIIDALANREPYACLLYTSDAADE